jgi:hypothetical protein
VHLSTTGTVRISVRSTVQSIDRFWESSKQTEPIEIDRQQEMIPQETKATYKKPYSLFVSQQQASYLWSDRRLAWERRAWNVQEEEGMPEQVSNDQQTGDNKPEHIYRDRGSPKREQVTSGMNKLLIDRDELLRSSGNRTDRKKRRLLNLRAVGVLLSPIAATDRGTDSHRIVQEEPNATDRIRRKRTERITRVPERLPLLNCYCVNSINRNSSATDRDGWYSKSQGRMKIWVLICVQD